MFKVYIAFLVAFVAANLIVKHFGATGLIFSSLLLIPFDFICRCLVHEKYTGWKLVFALFCLTLAAAYFTISINRDAKNIARASVLGFTAAQIVAGIVYQFFKRKGTGFFLKVNVSDLFAVIADSIVFQFVAFNSVVWYILVVQICIKFVGGLFWYYIIFKTKIYEKSFTSQ